MEIFSYWYNFKIELDKGMRRQKPKSHDCSLQIPCEIQTDMWESLYIISIWYAQKEVRESKSREVRI